MEMAKLSPALQHPVTLLLHFLGRTRESISSGHADEVLQPQSYYDGSYVGYNWPIVEEGGVDTNMSAADT